MFNPVKLFAFLVVLSAPLISRAQLCSFDAGTKTLYRAPAGKHTPAPAGYQPVFINHVGRHGARHLTKEVNTSFTWSLLMKADSAKELTTQGQQLRKMVIALDKVEHGVVKSISGEGINELEGIGKRMYRNNPQVFDHGNNLTVGFTKEIRTKQSADAFLKGLKTGFKDSAQIKEYNDDTDLRFYDTSPFYKAFEDNGSWTKQMDKLQQSLKMDAVNEAVAKRWLTPAFYKTLKTDEAEKLVNDVYGFATIVPSVREELPKAGLGLNELNFSSLFTCAELTALSKADIADDYLKKGPGTDNNGIQVRIAVPLLVNFIQTTDDFVKNGKVNADLRFAHAETIAPFAALLEITSANKVAKDITKLSTYWKSSDVAPLSANIQWIFYRKKGSDALLVKVLLNEKEAHIQNLATATFPYYKWTALRAYYMNKLGKLNVKLTDGMALYLANVK